MSLASLVIQVALSQGLVSREQIAAARAASAGGSDEAAVETLVARGYFDRRAAALLLAEEYALPFVDLADAVLPPKPEDLLEPALARRYKAIPLGAERGSLQVAISDPLDMDALDSLAHALQRPVEPFLAEERQLERALRNVYDDGGGPRFDSGGLQRLPSASDGEEGASLQLEAAPEQDDAPIIRLVQLIIAEAVRGRASDIHLEPLENRFRLRYRIDGALREAPNPPPKRLQLPVVSRIKVMANMSIAEKRLPLDGRIQARVDGADYDLRVSSLPTAYGESIVMRVLDKTGLMKGFSDLGFFSDDQELFERQITLPDGILLVTGPTGSGKTTTLYSSLNYINKPDRKIITVEDPIEYQMPGINQVPMNRATGMTFAAALKAMLRQAPNIIMVGEIRDLETAEIAINASLTGHMVFSTLHTNDAPSAVTRLVDIGVKPYLVATSLRCALAQRLARRLCPSCRQPYAPAARELRALGLDPLAHAGATFMRPQGCPKCHQLGTIGRFGLFEILTLNEELERLVYAGGTASQIRSMAKQLGMRSMREDGVRKVMAGLTTVEEILSVTVADPDATLA